MRQQRYRKARREAIAAQGIHPTNKQRAMCVRVTDTRILPAWLKSRLIPGLGSCRGTYWLKHKDAMAFITFCRTIHIWYNAVEVEFKRCVNCFRPLLAIEAEQIRLKMQTVSDRSVVRCGPNCDKEAKSELWHVLGELVAA